MCTHNLSGPTQGAEEQPPGLVRSRVCEVMILDYQEEGLECRAGNFVDDGRKGECSECEQVVRFRIGLSYVTLLFVVGTESESNEESGDPVRMQHI